MPGVGQYRAERGFRRGASPSGEHHLGEPRQHPVDHTFHVAGRYLRDDIAGGRALHNGDQPVPAVPQQPGRVKRHALPGEPVPELQRRIDQLAQPAGGGVRLDLLQRDARGAGEGPQLRFGEGGRVGAAEGPVQFSTQHRQFDCVQRLPATQLEIHAGQPGRRTGQRHLGDRPPVDPDQAVRGGTAPVTGQVPDGVATGDIGDRVAERLLLAAQPSRATSRTAMSGAGVPDGSVTVPNTAALPAAPLQRRVDEPRVDGDACRSRPPPVVSYQPGDRLGSPGSGECRPGFLDRYREAQQRQLGMQGLGEYRRPGRPATAVEPLCRP